MFPRSPPLALLRTFDAAARHLSFKLAAEELNITPAAVSQQIKSLETLLGVPLFERLTRALRLTDRGATMWPKVRQGLAFLASAVEGVQAPAGSVLMLTAPHLLASQWLIPHLPDFYATHPGIELRLSSSSEAVDHAGEAASLAALAARPASGRCELVIAYGNGPYARYRADALLTPEYVPVCAPELITAQAPLGTPEDLLRHLLIHDDTLRGAGHAGRQPWGWDQWMRGAGVEIPASQPGRRFSNAVLALEATLGGQGVALLPRPWVASHVAAGTLVLPFDVTIRSPYTYFLVTGEETARQAVVVAFRLWLLAQAQRLAGGASGIS
jgi:LysR family glycine cleavage system transcriptional activator